MKFPHEFEVKRNQYFAELPVLGEEWTIKFQVFLDRKPSSDYHSILHLTQGKDEQRYPGKKDSD